MYEIECIENRIRVYKNGSFYLEWDDNLHTDHLTYVLDHEELWELLPTLDKDTLEKVLSGFNADYNGVKYRKDKVGDYIKTDKGQLTFEL